MPRKSPRQPLSPQLWQTCDEPSRLLRWSRAASVQVVPNCVGMGGFYRGLAHLPQVASIWTGVVYTLALPPPAPPGSQLEAVASPDGALGTSTDRVRVLAGRTFDPADPRAPPAVLEIAHPRFVAAGPRPTRLAVSL